MTTLADINKTLLSNNVTQTETRDRVGELTKSFGTFLKNIEEDSGDELEAKREQKETNKKVQQATSKSESNGKGFFDFDVGNLVPLAGALLGGLLKRGIPAILAAVLADEVGEAVKKLTGSQILGSIAEWGTMGGAAGFLVGGVKGGIIGAVLGALFSDGARDAIATKLNELVGTELKKDDWQTLAISGGLAAASLTLPKLIGLMAVKLMPLFLGPKGLLIALAVAVGGMLVAYATNDEFRQSVNKALAPMFLAISDALSAVSDYIKTKINEFLPSFVTTAAEDRAIREQMSKTEQGQKLLQEESNIRGQISEIGGSRSELAGMGKKDIVAMQVLAKRLGISEVYGKKVDSYTANDAFMLQENLQNELLKRQGLLQGTLKREGGFQEMYDRIEKRLTQEDNAKAQGKKDAELKAKYQTTPLVKGSETANIQKTDIGTQATGSMGDMLLRAQQRRAAALNKSVSPSINQFELTKAATPTNIAAPVIDASTTNVGQSTTALVGSGANSFDANNPLVRRAMEAVVL